MPRFRMFAGPNGSGKSSLFNSLRKSRVIHTEYYICADNIVQKLKENSELHFNAYGVSTSQSDFELFINQSSFYKNLYREFKPGSLYIKSGVLKCPSLKVNSYIASLVTTYLVEKLFDGTRSFCYETVMSHPGKVEIMKMALAKGFRTYLYFVYTRNPDLNVERVHLRVDQKGHAVPENKIRERYDKCFKLLPKILPFVSSIYLIDNSGREPEVVAQGNIDKLNWVSGYQFNKFKRLRN